MICKEEGSRLNKTASGIMLTLILVGSLSLVFDIHPVIAEPGTIYIRADGSIDPPTAPISSFDNITYTFIGNISESVAIEKNNITVDGNGYMLQGTGSGNGFYVHAASNVRIKKANVEGFETGICTNSSSHCTLSMNRITNNGRGILLSSSPYSVVSSNNITYNSINVGVYLDGSSGTSIISDNIITNCHYYGISTGSSSNRIVRNKIIACEENGIYILGYSNDISGNYIESSGWSGIEFHDASQNVFSKNNVVNNNYGVRLTYSFNNNFSHNSVIGNSYGYSFDQSSYNVISEDNIANNGYGIHALTSPNNTIYHSNLLNNAAQVYVLSGSAEWDNGYPSGGNYWSDYIGVDLKNGTNQDGLASDSIGDTAFSIDADNVDHYPLMGPFGTFDALTWNGVSYSIDIVSKSNITNFNFNPYATPHPTLSFNVEGQDCTNGFCRVTIPKKMMWCNNPDEWAVIVDGTLYTNQTITTYENYTYIYFTYTHSTKTVQIQSTSAVPEFEPQIILALIAVAILLASMTRKRKPKR